MWIAYVHRELIYIFKPSFRKFTRKPMVSEKHISHTLSFSAGQPGCNQSIDNRHIWFNHNRATRYDDHNTLHIPANICDDTWTGVCNREV
ncbi:hypothetical protein HanRHA438_Chr11g0485781 [Helianthus annuus]|nr:hypothetical protein HanRHA438_Chr11g0485781 [Helianthus annuus]